MKLLTPLAIAISSVLISACSNHSVPTTPTATPQPTDPKETLSSAVKSQLRSSFSYRTDVYVSNHIRREALADVKTEADTEKSCDDRHDDAYVALKKQAKQEKKSFDEHYQDEKQAIKKAFLACNLAQTQKTNQYTPFDFDNFYAQYKQENAKDWAGEYMPAFLDHVNEQVYQEPTKQSSSHTPLDAKKAELLNEYLLKPSHISVVGRYSPLKGRVSALPSVGYDTKNLKFAINQPLYIDLNAEALYLWADNFALANSQLIDKKLGDKWKNKWLYVPLNDGSLPENFTKNLLKAYLKAKQESFLAMPKQSFVAVTPDGMAGVPFLSQNLPSDKLALIKDTPLIVKNTATPKDKAYSDYVFADVLYNTLAKDYPELTLEQAFSLNDPSYYERDIIDGESVIHVGASQETQEKLQNNTSKPPETTNSKFIMLMVMAELKGRVEMYYQTLGAKLPDAEPAKYAPITHYGMANGKIAWLHHRAYLTHQGLEGGQLTRTALSATEPMFVDAFTVVSQNAVGGEFDHLPAHAREPNKDNSIDFLAYKDELIEALKNSDDDYLKMMTTLILGETPEQESGEVDEAVPTDEMPK